MLRRPVPFDWLIHVLARHPNRHTGRGSPSIESATWHAMRGKYSPRQKKMQRPLVMVHEYRCCRCALLCGSVLRSERTRQRKRLIRCVCRPKPDAPQISSPGEQLPPMQHAVCHATVWQHGKACIQGVDCLLLWLRVLYTRIDLAAIRRHARELRAHSCPQAVPGQPRS